MGFDKFNELCIKNTEYVNTEQEMIFYSDYGIFLLKNNTFYKQNIESSNVIVLNILGYECLVDKSNGKFNLVYSQIPTDSISRHIKKKKYKIGELFFIIVMNDIDTIIDVYIENTIAINDTILKKLICSFLS